MENQLIQVSSNQLANIAKVEIDSQIATAKMYPRDEIKVIEKISKLATLDADTASSMFYALPRMAKNKATGVMEEKIIEGESIRFAELIMTCWGNIRISQPQVQFNEDNTLTVTVMAADLETNTAAPGICTKPIYKFDGAKELTIANATSGAIRNAIFRIVPKGLFRNVLEQIKRSAIIQEKKQEVKEKGRELTIKEKFEAWVKYFAGVGVTETEIFEALEINGIEYINQEHLTILKGFQTSIKDGIATIDEIFKGGLKEEKENDFNSNE